MSEATTEFQVEPFKITVSARGARSDGNYGSNEVFASVQQSIPDGVTESQILSYVAALAEPLKAAIEAALPEPVAPKAEPRPARSKGNRPVGDVKIVSWSPRDNGYVAVEDSANAGLFAKEGDTSWVIPQALAEFEGVREVHFAQKRDGSGTYFRAKGASEWLGYVNKPEGSAPQGEVTEEPF